ncbi:periodic tryptophan 1 homolog, partial [Olea europaea subsp. europaea]
KDASNTRQMNLDDVFLRFDKIPQLRLWRRSNEGIERPYLKYIFIFQIIFFYDISKEKSAPTLWLKLEQLCIIKSFTSKLLLKQHLYFHPMFVFHLVIVFYSPSLIIKVLTGNFVAVGTMDPAIEIWDLDIMGAVQPSFVLGGIIEKKRGKKKIIKYATGSHTDSVLELAWNKEYRNILASGSADKLAKIWDVTTRKCNLTMDHHTNKVQAVAWNRFAPQVLLTGSFDCSVVMKDSRIPSHSGFKWSVTAEVESLAWDPHTEHSFVVSLENGMVMGFDIRTASSDPKPSFTLHAHDKKVCTISYNSLVPNLLATGSIDKTVKLWDLTNNKPSCIASQNPKAGAVFSVSFSEDAPFLLAIGGSKKKLKIRIIFL